MTAKDVQRVINATPEEIKAGGKDYGVLKRFMKEQFDFNALCKVGFFEKEWRNDAYKQAVRVCIFFGYKTVFEYGSEAISGHISYVEGYRPKGEGFVSHIKSIYV